MTVVGWGEATLEWRNLSDFDLEIVSIDRDSKTHRNFFFIGFRYVCAGTRARWYREWFWCYVSMNLMNFWYSRLSLSELPFCIFIFFRREREIWCFGFRMDVEMFAKLDSTRELRFRTIAAKLSQSFLGRFINYFFCTHEISLIRHHIEFCSRTMLHRSLSSSLHHQFTAHANKFNNKVFWIFFAFVIQTAKTVCRCFTIDFSLHVTFASTQSSFFVPEQQLSAALRLTHCCFGIQHNFIDESSSLQQWSIQKIYYSSHSISNHSLLEKRRDSWEIIKLLLLSPI